MVEVLVKAAPIQAVSLNGVRPYVYQVFRNSGDSILIRGRSSVTGCVLVVFSVQNGSQPFEYTVP